MGQDTRPSSLTVSIVIPVLDDAAPLRALLETLRPGYAASAQATVGEECADDRQSAFDPEIIVVDGGSRDQSVAVAKSAGARVLHHSRGRGLQLDAGARAASGSWLWFLHADSRLSPEVLAEIDRLDEQAPGWGRFDVQLAQTPLLRLIAAMMNRRSAITGICTGDQGIFVHRSLLDAIGGVPRQRLMEDIELSKRLKRLVRPLRIQTPIQASARRWQTRGVLKTVVFMWWLRICYLFGAAPDRLARRYYD